MEAPATWAVPEWTGCGAHRLLGDPCKASLRAGGGREAGRASCSMPMRITPFLAVKCLGDEDKPWYFLYQCKNGLATPWCQAGTI